MSVTGRSPYVVGLDNGESVSILAENLSQSLKPFTLYDPSSQDKGYLRCYRDLPDDVDKKIISSGWGVGTRALFITSTIEGKPTGTLTPVISYFPDTQVTLSKTTLLESAVDPVLSYDVTKRQFTLYYWVNAWSPPLTSSPPSPPPPLISKPHVLFTQAIPPAPSSIDPDYVVDDSYLGAQPARRFTTIRDVPNWYLEGTAPDPTAIPGSDSERVGPLDIDRFWIAPFTDAHLFRFPADSDPFPPPISQTPVSPPSPPGLPPPPPGVVQEPPVDILTNFPFMIYPQTSTTQEINSILTKLKNSETLTQLEDLSLSTYRFALARLAGLNRCNRVLMKTTGFLYQCHKKEDDGIISESSSLYLVVEHPQPVLALSRGINKTLLGRPKLTSYLNQDFFITAALTFRSPAVATVTLTSGNPQVDFTVYSPSDHYDERQRSGILPEALTSQLAPFVPAETFVMPGGYGTSLVEVLSNLKIW